MKRKYIKPMASIENFAANEYVAACWGVACSTSPSNKYESSIWNSNQKHRDEHCGTATNQHITTDSHNVAISMIEDGTEGLGKLKCNLYTDGTYSKSRSYDSVHIGDYIYWTTSSGTGYNKRTWHHQGTVYSTYGNRPNHS